MTASFFLFEGLPLGWRLYFSVALAVVVAMYVWTVQLFVRSWISDRRTAHAPGAGTDRFLWVFLVPALNEEVTIRDSVERLLAIPLRRRLVVVIDDASDDATPEILESLHDEDLLVVRRELPEARRGKAAALNHAYRVVAERLGSIDHADVIVTIVDADGRLHPDAPAHAAEHFADASVGGVQTLVRIYNRHHLLTWLQDVEFGVYGHLFQAGRNDWGTAGMGGNGQCNRLSALDSVADGPGPWHDSLTEDQDLGLRLVAAGWKGHQELVGTVEQQGLSGMRALLRQRTRWSQGNLQALTLARAVARAPFRLAARVELLAHLFMPVWQVIVGVAVVAALTLALLGVAPLWAGGPTWQLALVYLLAFGSTVLGCVAARRHDGPLGWVVGFLLGHLYALYTWIIWPVLARSITRQVTRRQAWAKTVREPLTTSAAASNGDGRGALA